MSAPCATPSTTSAPGSPEAPTATAVLEALADRLGGRFVDRGLLACALSHRSWCAETPGASSNERLEFLGDAVLGLAVTDHIFCAYPDLPEGELAKVRATVVSAVTLAEVAAGLELGPALLLGRGEDLSGGRQKPSILADSTEAVIGAVYMDRGWEAARGLVVHLLGDHIAEAVAGPGGRDYKTRLQEVVARRFEALPHYAVAEQGPDHAKRFSGTVEVDGVVRGRGEGRSKKQAEQEAARVAWAALLSEGGRPIEASVRPGRGGSRA